MQDNMKPPCICIGSVKDEHYVHIYQSASRSQLGPFDSRIAALWAAGQEADRLGISRDPRK
jgi:hypothetical protein